MREAKTRIRRSGDTTLKVAIYHNILWSKYKGTVFSKLQGFSSSSLEYEFVQIAESEGDRAGLSPVDLKYHSYPYELLNNGSYSKIGNLHLVRQLFMHAWNNNADLTVIPGYHRPEYWAMLLALKVSGRKAAVFCDSTGQDKRQTRLKSILKRGFFMNCDGFFTYGTRSSAYLVENGANPQKIFKRCQAAALPLAYSESKARTQRERMRPSPEQPRFLFVGRLSPEKGLDTLLEAFRSFRIGNRTGKLVICGAGPLEMSLKEQVALDELGDFVEFTGGLTAEELQEEYLQATCLILPSTSEPWGLVVNEALHYGCPVVVSDACGCVPELVLDGISGVLVPVGDAAALAAALSRILGEFSTPEAAGRCFDTISTFTPERAAEQIHLGSTRILGVSPA